MFEYTIQYKRLAHKIKLTFYPDGQLKAHDLTSNETRTFHWRWRNQNLDVKILDTWDAASTIDDEDRGIIDAYKNYVAQLVVT